jgi:hypothetical protein
VALAQASGSMVAPACFLLIRLVAGAGRLAGGSQCIRRSCDDDRRWRSSSSMTTTTR